MRAQAAAASLLGIAMVLVATPAAARPEVTTNLAVTYGRRSSGSTSEGLFGLDLHAALLGDRESGSGFAAGGVIHLGGYDFAELHAGLGAALLLPVLESWPVVLEAFPVLVADERGFRTGAAARVFWGAHSFPRIGSYVLTAGLVLEARWLAPTGARRDVIDLHVGIDVDAFALLWPWMFLFEAIFG